MQQRLEAIVAMAGWAGVGVLVAACGLLGDDINASGEANVVGDVVVVDVGVTDQVGATNKFTVNGVEVSTEDNWGHFVFPLEGMSPGPTTWSVTANQNGTEQTSDVTFTVPGKPSDAPFVHLVSCSGDPKLITETRLNGDAVSERMVSCKITGDGQLPLSYAATSGAIVRLGAATLPTDGYPAKGKPMTANIPYLGVVAAIPANKYSSVDGVEIPLTAELNGKTTTTSVSLDHEGLLGAFVGEQLRKVQKGQGLSWADANGGKEKLAVVVRSDHDHIRSVGTEAPLAEVDLVVITTRKAPRNVGECGPYAPPGGGEEKMAPHALVDEDVVVYRAHDGKELARETFEAVEEPCPDQLREDGLFVNDYVKTEIVDGLVTPLLTGGEPAEP